MNKLPILTQLECVRTLQCGGFRHVRNNGSHRILKGHGRTVSVPDKLERRRTIASVLKQANLTIEQFNQLRKD